MKLNIGSVLEDVKRAVAARRLEVDIGSGAIAIPGGRHKGRIFFGGVFKTRFALPGEDFGAPIITANRVVGQGLNRFLNLLGGHVVASPLYIAPFSNDVTIDGDLNAATFDAVCNELTAYSPSTRLPWTTVATANGTLTNAAALAAATLTLNPGGPYNVRGLALLTSSVKESTTGDCVVASRLTNDILGLPGGSRLATEYSLTALDESDVP